jgi:hypothetical protein
MLACSSKLKIVFAATLSGQDALRMVSANLSIFSVVVHLSTTMQKYFYSIFNPNNSNPKNINLVIVKQ